MDVRLYQPADKQACLTVFDSNVPDFFAVHERGEFAVFLETLAAPYYVMEHDGAVAGCGGYTVTGHAARLTWGMIRRDLHRKGLGRFLLLFRLREMTRTDTAVETVGLETSQLSAPFFVSQGFRIARPAGLDRVELTKRLTVCA